MKKVTLLVMMLTVGAFGQSDTVVRWRGLEGVISALGVDNPVGSIHSGAGPWTTRGGSARINLRTGEGSFDVDGLVLNGGNSTGTTGPVATVIGTLVCNAGTAGEVVLDTPAAALSAEGNAELSFKLNVPTVCDKQAFLIRTASGRWIATGTKPASSTSSRY
jgi:hypothetical protein